MGDTITTKTGISPQKLGQERNRYFEMSQIDGVTKKQIESQMKLDARRWAKKLSKEVSFEDYKVDIEALPKKKSGGGKREADKVERDNLIIETQELNGVNNLAILSHTGKVTLSVEDKAKAFDIIGERAEKLATHMVNAFDKIGGMTMIYPVNTDGQALLCVHIAGWEDGSKNMRYQYSPRKLPITKQAGYHDYSLHAPIFDVTKQPEVTAEPEPEPNKEPENTDTAEVKTEAEKPANKKKNK